MSGGEGFWFLFAAYGAFWAILAWFLMRLGRRHRELERELIALETRLSRPPAT
jgi:CcmD family protein